MPFLVPEVDHRREIRVIRAGQSSFKRKVKMGSLGSVNSFARRTGPVRDFQHFGE